MKKTILVLIISLFLCISCQTQTIVGNWRLTSIILEGDMAYSINDPVTLNIDETGRFSGNGGCNEYVGLYSFENPAKSFKKPQKIKFSDVIFCSAKKTCQLSSKTENVFFTSLKEAATVDLAKDELIIKNKAIFVKTPNGNVVIQNTMTFEREVKPK